MPHCLHLLPPLSKAKHKLMQHRVSTSKLTLHLLHPTNTTPQCLCLCVKSPATPDHVFLQHQLSGSWQQKGIGCHNEWIRQDTGLDCNTTKSRSHSINNQRAHCERSVTRIQFQPYQSLLVYHLLLGEITVSVV